MAGIFKSLQRNDYTVTRFPAYYDYTYTYESGSTSSTADVQVLYAIQYVTSSENPAFPRVPNFQYDLFDSIVQNFYSELPYVSYGTTSTSYIPSASTYVISISQNLFGESIVPGTFSFSINSTSSYDDGIGNIIVSQSGVGNIVGRIFYDKGVAVLKPTTSSITNGGIVLDGAYIPESSISSINFTSSLSMYEHVLRVEIAPTEFLKTYSNPTILTKMSGSRAKRPVDMIRSGSLLPYITTIGFYNDNNELVAVAKPSVPVQRTPDMPQTFIVKFDIY